MNWDSFKIPPNSFRPAAFWAWNDELEEKELLTQIDHFAAAGFGGFFMHARGGLKTPYLSKMMMDYVKTCVKYAKEKGLDAWIYDEHGWPSGQAAGNVQKIRSTNTVKHLVCKPAIDDFIVPGEVRREFINGTKMIFSTEYGWGAEQLNPRAVKDFIELTHELYKENCKEYFGNTIPGTFFDEPQYSTYYDVNDYIPWTPLLPEVFKNRCGYELINNLKSLFYDVGDYEKVRIDYWHTVSELYAKSFAKQIMDWCEQNNLISTGHFELEETFYGQIRCCGNLMRQYEFMHYPGNDHLGRGMFAPWIYKQTASVVAQLAKPRYMVECFGTSGQNMSLHDKRWLYGSLLSLGANFLVPHISLYSLRGDNKRDHPPFNLHQQPWWKYNRPLEDSVSRAAYILSQGNAKADVLVINPIVTAWSDYKPGDTAKIDELQNQYEKVNMKLLNNGIVYHIGEETLFSKYAEIKNDTFCVGEMKYSSVILPYIKNILPETVLLLHEFSKCGGKICILGRIPIECEDLKADYFDNDEVLLDWVKANTKPDAVFNTNGKELWVQNFELDGYSAWLLSNPDRLKTINVKMIPVNNTMAINRLLTESGESVCIKSANYKECSLQLYGGEYAVLMQTENGIAESEILSAPFSTIDYCGEWTIESKLHTSEYKNCANLDFCRLKFGEGGWSHPMYTRDVYDLLAKQMGEDTQVLAGWAGDFTKVFSYQAQFEFINNAFGCSMAICVENPEELGITINGKQLLWQDAGSFIDSSFRSCSISEYACDGLNEIVLCGKKRPNFTFEDIYILGDFAVALNEDNIRVFSPLPKTISNTSNLDETGYKFFTGEIYLSCDIEVTDQFTKANLVIEEPNATVLEVIINGKKAAALWCFPWEIDVTNLLIHGTNAVTIKVVNSLRNLLGPLHNTLGEFTGIGPAQYNNKKVWNDRPISVPLGFDKIHINLMA